MQKGESLHPGRVITACLHYISGYVPANMQQQITAVVTKKTTSHAAAPSFIGMAIEPKFVEYMSENVTYSLMLCITTLFVLTP